MRLRLREVSRLIFANELLLDQIYHNGKESGKLKLIQLGIDDMIFKDSEYNYSYVDLVTFKKWYDDTLGNDFLIPERYIKRWLNIRTRKEITVFESMFKNASRIAKYYFLNEVNNILKSNDKPQITPQDLYDMGPRSPGN